MTGNVQPSIHSSSIWRLFGVRLLGQQPKQRGPHFPLFGHLFQGNPEVFPVCPEATLWICPEQLTRELSRWHPNQIPELYAEEQRLMSPSRMTEPLISQGEPRNYMITPWGKKVIERYYIIESRGEWVVLLKAICNIGIICIVCISFRLDRPVFYISLWSTLLFLHVRL